MREGEKRRKGTCTLILSHTYPENATVALREREKARNRECISRETVTVSTRHTHKEGHFSGLIW